MRAFACLLIALMGAGAPVRAAEAFEAWRERTSMLLIGEHCKVLGKLQQAALLSGQTQARGALLRAGKAPRKLAQLQDNLARRAQNVACENAAVVREINRMNEAAQIWSHLLVMRFPARWQSWVARRDDARDKARWRVRMLLEDEQGRPFDFGLVAQGDAFYLGLLASVGPYPSSVVLHLRDTQKLAAPLDADVLRLMGRSGKNPASLMPPSSVTKSFFASQKNAAPASLSSQQGASTAGVLLRFSSKALAAFEAADPRDVAALELIYPARAERPFARHTLYLEIADFNAALLFAKTNAGDPANTGEQAGAAPAPLAVAAREKPAKTVRRGFWR